MKKLTRKFWAAMLIFGLMGQVAWVVENMYFNVFIYKMFHASAGDISLMVAASSVAATLTTILMGALSDKMGKRKLLICLGYLVWGVSILSFALIRVDVLTPIAGSAAAASALGITLVIILDCVMTFFGSTANDAAYNAWLTDWGDETNRGKIEGFNSMMPLVSILVVFGGFMGFNLDQAESWTMIFIIIGGGVMIIGVLGFFLIEDAPAINKADGSYWKTVIYSFRPAVMKENVLLYMALIAFAVFGISIQIFMPYLIIYYEQSLQMTNYVFIMAPAIIVAAVITALYGKVYDTKGFQGSVIPSISVLMLGYVILYFTRSMVPVFIGSLMMMSGYMTGMSVFGAMIRDHIPEHRAGQFQGIRIIGQVLVPGIIGPAIGAWILRDAQMIVNNDGTTSFLPHEGIWVGAFVAAVVLWGVLVMIFKMEKKK
ncbi:MAG: MFS transporter [Firmicutes bacterium]|nr:MFS transporter [Bacillota bacterium]